MNPGTPPQALAAALREHQAGNVAQAERLYRKILEGDPRNADALNLLGLVAHQTGRIETAVDLISQAISLNGRMPAFHNNLGGAYLALGRFEEAVACCRAALALKPDYLQAHYNLGLALQAQGKLDEAEASIRQTLARAPQHFQALNTLGNILYAKSRYSDAVASYRQALALQPNYPEAHCNLGNVLKAQGRLDDAVTSYRKALDLKPSLAEAHCNLGIVLLDQDQPEEAEASLRRALVLKPDYPEAYCYLGNALREEGKRDEAAASYRQALSLKPDMARASLGLAFAAIPVFPNDIAESSSTPERFGQALDDLAAWNEAHPGKLGEAVGTSQPFYLAYRPTDISALLCRYGDLAANAASGHKAAAPRSPRSRIRLGIVSGQVRRHPVWDVILRGIIQHIDREKFEVVLYHTGIRTDGETAWAKTRVDCFVEGPKPPVDWRDEIARDRPDVMFFPEVGMDAISCALATQRLAPLQIASWGHPVTTGLPSIDLYLSGDLLEGPDADRHYREKLIRLPGTGVCTQAEPVVARPFEGAAEGVVRFAICQQPIKFDPADDAVLARIAKAAGACEFWLTSPKRHHWATLKLRDRLAAAFRAEGADESCLKITPWLRQEEFAGYLDAMDVFLDCPGFSGYTTAWHAIGRGVPIVTVEGEFMRQRLAAGLLRQIGMTDGIATSRQEYGESAVRLATESREARAARRETIRLAATKADGNVEAVKALERTVSEAWGERR